MAQFGGGNKNQPPWATRPGGPPPHGAPPPGAMDMQGLMGFGGPQAGPPVFAAQGGHHAHAGLPPGLPLVHAAGGHTPVTVATLAGQPVRIK